MHDVFVSYSRTDKVLVSKLVRAFKDQGWAVWWDEELEVGKKYARSLDEALNQSRCVIVCWSHGSVQSDYVKSEAHRADARNRLVQVKLDDVVVPSPFDDYTYADLTSWPDSEYGSLEFKKLVRDVSGRLALARTAIPVDTSSYVPGFEGRPAVAVLPFANHTADEAHEITLGGLTEDLTDRLQRYRSIPIIAHQSAKQFSEPFDFRDIAAKLGAEFFVTGGMRVAGEEMRLRISLVQAPNFESVWSKTLNVNDNGYVVLDDELSLSLAAVLQPEIERSARRSSLPIRKEDATTWHLLRQGSWHFYALRKDSAGKSLALFKEALERDPESAEAHIQLGWWHLWDVSTRRGSTEEWDVVEAFARRASELDPHDSRPHGLIGLAHMHRFQHRQAMMYYEQAVEMNPSYAWAYAHMGSCLYLMGEPEQSLGYVTKAVRLSPLDFFVFHSYTDMATAHYMLGNYSSALDAVEYSLTKRTGYWLAHIIRICTLMKVGRREDAKEALQEFFARKPSISTRDIEWVMFTDRKWNQDLIETMQEAGWR